MKGFSLFFLFAFSLSAFAQEDLVLTEEIPEESQVYLAEEKAQQQSVLDLNKANAVELMASNLLTKEQVQAILKHREKYNGFSSIYELQTIPTLSVDTLRLLSDKLVVHQAWGERYAMTALLKEGSHYHLLRWGRKTRTSRGYHTDSKGNRPYPGEDYSLLYRFRSSVANKYQFGVSFEKDPGEQWQWIPSSKQYGFDHVSAYLLLYAKKIIRQVALGDFQFRSGHGLVFGGSFFQSKNPEYWQGTWQLGTGFRPHSSSAEYGFSRGMGIKAEVKGIESSWYYSQTLQDGTLSSGQYISAINTSGLHRTTAEIQKRYNTTYTSTGGNLCYTLPNKRWKAGLEYLYHRFSYPLIPSDVYYHLQSFKGKEHQIGGVFVQYLHASGMVFAEAALSPQQGKAIYGGIIHNLSRQNTWIMQAWAANASFSSLQGNTPSYSSNGNNETGIYQAFVLQLSKKTRCSFGWSMFTNPQPAFKKSGSSYGSEWINRVTHTLKKKTIAYLQFRWRSNEENYAVDSLSGRTQLLPLTRYYLTADLSHQENLAWGFHSRVQLASFEFPLKEKGYCISQSIRYRYAHYQLTAQVSLFESDSWNSRLYAYEPDVPLAFSIPPLSGKGTRLCVIATTKLFRFLEASAKIAHVVYTHQKSIGSGYDEVTGNEQTEIKMQLRIFM